MDYSNVTDGILLVDKPRVITSYRVVEHVKRILKIKKVGHAGTLDPAAEGLLIILMGKSTKLSEQYMNQQKEYIGWMLLGVKTDSGDREGNILCRKAVGQLRQDEIKKIIDCFKGEIEQIPPMYSALKKDGKPLYVYARKNIQVERPKRKVNIYHIELLDIMMPYILLKVVCSRGTYIRTLCEDIAEKLGTVGTLYSLIRTRSGGSHLKNAVGIEEIR